MPREALARPGDRMVLGGAEDGGYYLIGLKAPHAALFRDIAWSTDQVAAQTLAQAATLGLEVVTLPPWFDVDDAASLTRLVDDLATRATASGPTPYAAPATRAWLAQVGMRERLASRTQMRERFPVPLRAWAAKRTKVRGRGSSCSTSPSPNLGRFAPQALKGRGNVSIPLVLRRPACTHRSPIGIALVVLVALGLFDPLVEQRCRSTATRAPALFVATECLAGLLWLAAIAARPPRSGTRRASCGSC